MCAAFLQCLKDEIMQTHDCPTMFVYANEKVIEWKQSFWTKISLWINIRFWIKMINENRNYRMN